MTIALPESTGVTTLAPRPRVASPATVQAPLSRDDLRLLAVIATGIPVSAVGSRLGVSDRTIRRRVRTICDELGVLTSIEAVAWAARRRYI